MSALPAVLVYGGAAAPVAGEAIHVEADGDFVILDPYDASFAHYTFTGWARLTNPDGNNHCAFAESKGTGFSAVAFGISNNIPFPVGTPSMQYFTGNSGASPYEAPEANRWFFFSFVKSNSVIDCRWCYLEETVFAAARTCGNESSFGSGIASAATAGEYRESDGFFFLPLNGDFCQIRRWSASLSEVELLAEKDSPTVVRTANLFSSNPFAGSADMSDESGNDHVGVPNGTLTNVTDGPGN